MKNNAQLYQDVKEKLDFEPGIDHRNITYSTHNGIVTLNGTVRSYMEKQAVKHTLRNIDGVKGIADEITVEPISPLQSNDSDIAAAAVRMLEWDPTFGDNSIKVTVEKGKVTLTGDVDWYFQKRNAAQKVRCLPGVICINNLINVKPSLEMDTPLQVKEKIKREFERHALLDAKSISVEILGTTITLKGQVQSWAEYKEAAHIAWSIPGVSHVDNQILITSNA